MRKKEKLCPECLGHTDPYTGPGSEKDFYVDVGEDGCDECDYLLCVNCGLIFATKGQKTRYLNKGEKTSVIKSKDYKKIVKHWEKVFPYMTVHV